MGQWFQTIHRELVWRDVRVGEGASIKFYLERAISTGINIWSPLDGSTPPKAADPAAVTAFSTAMQIYAQRLAQREHEKKLADAWDQKWDDPGDEVQCGGSSTWKERDDKLRQTVQCLECTDGSCYDCAQKKNKTVKTEGTN